MTKQNFINELKSNLSGLPENEVEERLTFYSEMIDDNIEEGLSEDEAVSKIGTVEEISKQILNDIPLTKIVKEKVKPSHELKTWEIILLILGSPLWFSLLIAFFSIIFAGYVVVFSLFISLWTVFVSLAISSIIIIISAIFFMFNGNVLSGFALAGFGLFFCGISIFLFFGCKISTKGIFFLTKKIVLSIKSIFIRKG